jgi:hypothetical protein
MGSKTRLRFRALDFFVNDATKGAMGKPLVDGDSTASVTVSLTSAPWIGVGRVNVYRNGLLANKLDVEPGHDMAQNTLRETFDLPLDATPEGSPRDSWFVVEAIGYDSMFPVIRPLEIPPLMLSSRTIDLGDEQAAGRNGARAEVHRAVRPTRQNWASRGVARDRHSIVEDDCGVVRNAEHEAPLGRTGGIETRGERSPSAARDEGSAAEVDVTAEAAGQQDIACRVGGDAFAERDSARHGESTCSELQLRETAHKIQYVMRQLPAPRAFRPVGASDYLATLATSNGPPMPWRAYPVE